MDFRGNSHEKQRSKSRVLLRRRMLVERLNERCVLATITGLVFEDANQSYQQDAAEQSLPQRLVYLDLDQNGALDSGEPTSIGDDRGNFFFTGLDDGDYDLRLYDGSVSQTQVFPTDVVQDSAAVLFTNPLQVVPASGDVAFALSSDSVTVGNLDDATQQRIPVGENLTSAQLLGNGSLLVTGGDPGVTSTAWIVDPNSGSLASVDLSGSGTPPGWSSVVIDGSGYGLAIEQTDESLASLYAIDMSDLEQGIIAEDVRLDVPSDAKAITSSTGGRSIIAWTGGSGLELSLWSNSTGTWITYIPVQVDGVRELIEFDDASGLLIARTTDGGVGVYDVNADFAPLLTLPEAKGPVALNASNETLITVDSSSMNAIDIRTGITLIEWPVDLSALGNLISVHYLAEANSVLVAGDSGTSRYSLSTPAPHRITIVGGVDPAPTAFGVTLDGDNTLPRHTLPLSFETDEDVTLVSSVTNAMTGVEDVDGDRVVSLGVPTTPGASVSLSVNGDFVYVPRPDFFGQDQVPVVLHDGRGAQVSSIDVTVNPVPDPSQVSVQLRDLPEDSVAGVRVGSIQIIDPDLGEEHAVTILDTRFAADGNEIIFIGQQGDLDYETESLIDLQIVVYDLNRHFEDVVFASLQVLDVNEAITDIYPHEASVAENEVGASIALLTVEDEDTGGSYTLTVNDSRFVVVDDELLLAPDAHLDYEESSVVSVNVTASDDIHGDTFTQEVRISVIDVAEQVAEINLNGQTVVELSPGAEVGQIVVDGFDLGDSNTATVNDSRFEINGNNLKLKDEIWVERADQEEIELTISVQDASGEFDAVNETFVIQVTENPTPFHNDVLPYDVDGSNETTPFDALVIINYLNEHGPGPIEHGDPNFDIDVNGDGHITPLDALLILNELSAQLKDQAQTVGGEESEGVNPTDELQVVEDTSPQGELIEPTDVSSEEVADTQQPEVLQNNRRFVAQSQQQMGNLAVNGSTEPVELIGEADSDYAEGVDASLDSLLDDIG